MKFNSRQHSDPGSAAIELLGFGILLQIPILLFATSAASVQHQSFAAEAIARNVVRSFVLLREPDSVEGVILELAQSYSIDPTNLSWTMHCTPDPSCLGESGSVTITVKYQGQVAVGHSVF